MTTICGYHEPMTGKVKYEFAPEARNLIEAPSWHGSASICDIGILDQPDARQPLVLGLAATSGASIAEAKFTVFQM